MSKKDILTFGTFLTLYDTIENLEDVMKRLKEQPQPLTLCGKDVPQTLNGLSYGTLDDLQTSASEKDAIVKIAEILIGCTREELLEEDVNKVFGFFQFVSREIERINKLFSSIKCSYSDEEVSAGVKELQFGSFGVLDWYAQRMHIANQNDVRDIAWVRIYQCMRNDNDKSEYERRLYKVYERKQKSRSKK